MQQCAVKGPTSEVAVMELCAEIKPKNEARYKVSAIEKGF